MNGVHDMQNWKENRAQCDSLAKMPSWTCLLAVLKFDNENSIFPLLVNTHRDCVYIIKSQDLTRHILIDLILVVRATV